MFLYKKQDFKSIYNNTQLTHNKIMKENIIKNLLENYPSLLEGVCLQYMLKYRKKKDDIKRSNECSFIYSNFIT